MIDRPPAIVVTPPVDREIPKVVADEQPTPPEDVQPTGAPNSLQEINRQDSAIILDESHDAIPIVREESMTAVSIDGSEVDLIEFTKSFTAGTDMELDCTLGNLSIETSSIQRLQLQIIVPEMIAHDQHSFERFVLPEERQSLEVQKREYFVQTATPIVVGTAIGAGISLHVLMTAHFGSSLLSQSGVFMPLDPLTILEGTAKVKKSKAREDLLFEGVAINDHASK
jgi:hypothetical protein